MCMSPSSLGNCTICSTWCIMICLVIPTLSLLLFIQSLYFLTACMLLCTSLGEFYINWWCCCNTIVICRLINIVATSGEYTDYQPSAISRPSPGHHPLVACVVGTACDHTTAVVATYSSKWCLICCVLV